MSNLLINEPPLQVLPSLAKAVGLNESIVLQQSHYWLRHAKVKHDGKMWFYKTFDEWQEQDFPFWSTRTIKRAVTSLISQELLLVSKLASNSFNRVNHYTVNYEKLAQIDLENNSTPISADSDTLAQSSESTCHQHSDTLALSDSDNLSLSDSDNLSQSLRDNKETTQENTKESTPPPKKTANDKFKPVKPEQVSDQVWNDLLALRKKKGAIDSQTAWTRINNSIERAQQATGHTLENIFSYWVMRAWAGFDEKWYINAHPQPTNTYQGNTHAQHQPANNQHQPKQSEAESYAEQLARDIAEHEARQQYDYQ
jgi:hypothetical protein